MYHIVLLLLTGVLMYLGWLLVHSVPRVLSMMLPGRVTFTVGLGLFTASLFAAFFAAYAMKSPESVFGCFIQVYVGLWLMCATSAGARGTESDERMLKRVFAVLGIMMLMIIGTLYVPEHHLVSILNLLMIVACFWVTTNYFQLLDRGR